MQGIKKTFVKAFSAVEGFFDWVKLSYKWRFNRWEHLRIDLYKGYGTPEALYLRGRVLDDEPVVAEDNETLLDNIRDTIQRVETDDIPGARVRVHFREQTLELETDEDGFFEVCIEPEGELPKDQAWHEVSVELLKPSTEQQPDVRATGAILVPQPDVEFGIISDLDDTVVRTGATSKLRMMQMVMLNDANTRVPFEGVAAFYRALQKGPDAEGHNPIFYVSSSPWNLYSFFASFMEAHDIPPGPIFLKDFGFTEDKFLKSGHLQHKLDRINLLLDTYPDLPFILIGDSGQKDPEVYRKIVADRADRLRAIYIRDVTPDARDAEVEQIAEEARQAGVPMVLVETTTEAAEHAAEHGLITQDALAEVEADKQQEEEKETPGLKEKLLG